MRIALAQINTTVGALEENCGKIINYIQRARREGADIVVFPELALSGYPAEDLLLKRSFLKANRAALGRICGASKDIFTIVGFPERRGRNTYNSAALIYDRMLIDVYRKIVLPNYGVFDEKRYFKRGAVIPIIPFRENMNIGINICEDIWHPAGPHKLAVSNGKARLIINISASPYHTGKIRERQRILRERALRNKVFICYCNLTGGQDELVFDGGSLIFGPGGSLLGRAGEFKEDLLIADINIKDPKKSIVRKEKLLKPDEEVYSALMLGLKDYVHKNGFERVILGLSGGIDSALTAAICCEALGCKNVTALSMPSRFTSGATKNDTRRIASNLGIRLTTIAIENIYKRYLKGLKGCLRGVRADIVQENLQARIRGNILMAFSNRFGWLVISTGNKSEISVGYCTLYGDMAGGFALLKDVPKGLVYRLAEYVNQKSGRDLIPRSVMRRAPTAELRFGQRDSDTLPPYSLLDRILDLYIEKDMTKDEIIECGFSKKTVAGVISMVDRNEYKRRQSPPGVKITPKAFGRDRRMPIVNKFNED